MEKVREGELVQLKCIVDSNPAVQRVDWYYKVRKVLFSPGNQAKNKKSGFCKNHLRASTANLTANDILKGEGRHLSGIGTAFRFQLLIRA